MKESVEQLDTLPATSVVVPQYVVSAFSAAVTGTAKTPEGVAVGLVFGYVAVWLAIVSIKLVSVTWALIFTTLKYGAIAGVLVLLGVLAS